MTEQHDRQTESDQPTIFERLISRWAWFVAPVALIAWFAMLWLMFGDVL